MTFNPFQDIFLCKVSTQSTILRTINFKLRNVFRDVSIETGLVHPVGPFGRIQIQTGFIVSLKVTFCSTECQCWLWSHTSNQYIETWFVSDAKVKIYINLPFTAWCFIWDVTDLEGRICPQTLFLNLLEVLKNKSHHLDSWLKWGSLWIYNWIISTL